MSLRWSLSLSEVGTTFIILFIPDIHYVILLREERFLTAYKDKNHLIIDTLNAD